MSSDSDTLFFVPPPAVAVMRLLHYRIQRRILVSFTFFSSDGRDMLLVRASYPLDSRRSMMYSSHKLRDGVDNRSAPGCRSSGTRDLEGVSLIALLADPPEVFSFPLATSFPSFVLFVWVIAPIPRLTSAHLNPHTSERHVV